EPTVRAGGPGCFAGGVPRESRSLQPPRRARLQPDYPVHGARPLLVATCRARRSGDRLARPAVAAGVAQTRIPRPLETRRLHAGPGVARAAVGVGAALSWGLVAHASWPQGEAGVLARRQADRLRAGHAPERRRPLDHERRRKPRTAVDVPHPPI